MPTQTDSKLWARPGLLAVLLFTLLAPLFLSGCCFIIPGTSCSEWFKSPCSFTYAHEIRHAENTPYGWVGVYESYKYCNDKRNSRYSNDWWIVGFSEEEPKNVYTGNDPEICSSCTLKTSSSDKIENVEVSFSAPNWMRISADFDSELEILDYVVSNNGNKKTNRMQCNNPSLDEDPSLKTCEGSFQSRWAQIAEELDNPTIFDKNILDLFVDHSDHTPQVIDGLKYFADTWKDASGERTGETILTLLDFIEGFDCSDPFVVDQWKDYLDAIDVILTPELKASTLERCGGSLAATQRPRVNKEPPSLLRIKALEDLDAELLTRIRTGEDFGWHIWLNRLDERPAPSEELIALVDQRLFEQLPESSKESEKRLLDSTPISPANATLLLEQAVAESSVTIDLISAIFERPEMAEHRDALYAVHGDALDQAWIDAMSEQSIPDSARKMFKLRMTSLNTHPLSSSNFKRLQDVLVANLDMRANEAMTLLEHADDDTRKLLLQHFDTHIAGDFPSGSAFFLKRLPDNNLPRAEQNITDEILDKARALKKNGMSFGQAPCEVVRRLMFLPASEGKCELPENL